jgi:hypothetical protein
MVQLQLRSRSTVGAVQTPRLSQLSLRVRSCISNSLSLRVGIPKQGALIAVPLPLPLPSGSRECWIKDSVVWGYFVYLQDPSVRAFRGCLPKYVAPVKNTMASISPSFSFFLACNKTITIYFLYPPAVRGGLCLGPFQPYPFLSIQH